MHKICTVAHLNPNYPLAACQSWDDWRSGSVSPEAGEPRTFLSGHGEHQPILAGVLVTGAADGRYQVVKSEERMLYPRAQNCLTVIAR